MHAFILAGGFATRLWPLTEKRAKPLLPLAGKPIITHLVEKIPSGIPITVSTNAAMQDGFKRWLDDVQKSPVGVGSLSRALPRGERPLPIKLVVEGTTKDDHKLGALGSIAQWVETEKIEDDLLILTGDNYLGFSLEEFLKAFTGNPLLAAHDVGDLERAKSFGVVTLKSQGSPLPASAQRALGEGSGEGVLAFSEKPKDPTSTLVSTGCVVIPKNVLPVLRDYAKVKPDNLGGIFEELLRKNIPVDCFTFSGHWMDIGSFHSYLDAHRELVGEQALVDPTASVKDTEMRGSVTVGKNCVIERSELVDCMVFDGVTIRDCTLRDCVIDDGCALQGIDLQKQMLRTGTKLIVH
ncbi:NDP-sugar synthase [Candidatus Peribacteria bacterium]|nr:NDP-sugar synthase [Candidatus Peribacteria bacterium]